MEIRGHVLIFGRRHPTCSMCGLCGQALYCTWDCLVRSQVDETKLFGNLLLTGFEYKHMRDTHKEELLASKPVSSCLRHSENRHGTTTAKRSPPRTNQAIYSQNVQSHPRSQAMPLAKPILLSPHPLSLFFPLPCFCFQRAQPTPWHYSAFAACASKLSPITRARSRAWTKGVDERRRPSPTERSPCRPRT